MSLNRGVAGAYGVCVCVCMCVCVCVYVCVNSPVCIVYNILFCFKLWLHHRHSARSHEENLHSLMNLDSYDRVHSLTPEGMPAKRGWRVKMGIMGMGIGWFIHTFICLLENAICASWKNLVKDSSVMYPELDESMTVKMS